MWRDSILGQCNLSDRGHVKGHSMRSLNWWVPSHILSSNQIHGSPLPRSCQLLLTIQSASQTTQISNPNTRSPVWMICRDREWELHYGHRRVLARDQLPAGACLPLSDSKWGYNRNEGKWAKKPFSLPLLPTWGNLRPLSQLMMGCSCIVFLIGNTNREATSWYGVGLIRIPISLSIE